MLSPRRVAMVRFLLVLLVVLLPWVLTPALAGDAARLQPDIVYGQRDGIDLTFDMLTPATPNGAGILWLQSAGWYSKRVEPKIWLAAGKPFFAKGYTLFIVRHSNPPKSTVPECTEDVRRCVRFIRRQAKAYGIDPERLGVMGSSAGGHLSLMLGTTGDNGDPQAKDEVLRQSSRVAAVVSLFGPTDLRVWVTNPPKAIKDAAILKPPLSFDAKKAPDYSPLLQVTAKSVPTLMIHGDKDLLVPLSHSQQMQAALAKAHVPCKLITVPGAAHGFNAQQQQQIVLPAIFAWFDQYLAAKQRQ